MRIRRWSRQNSIHSCFLVYYKQEGAPVMSYAPRVCQHCNASYLPSNKAQRFCSKPCWHQGTGRVKKEHNCDFCGTVIIQSRSSNRFCSSSCSSRFHHSQRPVKGFINEDGYRIITVNGRQVAEHRHLMALHLGRDLLPGEVVHHKDGNPANNAIDNLCLMPSQSDHIKAHARGFRTDTHKECLICREVKPNDGFYGFLHKKYQRRYLNSYCKQCQNRHSDECKRRKQSSI